MKYTELSDDEQRFQLESRLLEAERRHYTETVNLTLAEAANTNKAQRTEIQARINETESVIQKLKELIKELPDASPNYVSPTSRPTRPQRPERPQRPQ